jgi:hypothetical protein
MSFSWFHLGDVARAALPTVSISLFSVSALASLATAPERPLDPKWTLPQGDALLRPPRRTVDRVIARNGSHKDLATVRRVAARCAAAARYFKAMRCAAGRRIIVVAGDIKDDPAMTGWLRAYKREVRGAKVWALHNFKDATSQYTRGTTRAFVRMVRGPVWLIETGGIRSRGGLQGQARSVKRNFALTPPTARSDASTATGGGRSATATGTPHSCRPPASAAPPTTRCATACAAAEPVSSRRGA